MDVQPVSTNTTNYDDGDGNNNSEENGAQVLSNDGYNNDGNNAEENKHQSQNYGDKGK